jgi:hypothetical protein
MKITESKHLKFREWQLQVCREMLIAIYWDNFKLFFATGF